MILGFKTKINGEQTYFVEKILALVMPEYARKFNVKRHTIRDGNRWKEGISIQMATGVRTKHYNQFNKGISQLETCTNVQNIQIINVYSDTFPVYGGDIIAVKQKISETDIVQYYRVAVDGRNLDKYEIQYLALSDGFDSFQKMMEWFEFKEINSQLIHWTELRY